jgi:two-component system sensor histidine kinase AlgZ
VRLQRAKLGLYALAAIAMPAVLLSIALLTKPEVPLGAAVVAALIPSFLLAVIGLASRYPCRALPLRRTTLTRLAATHLATAAAAAGLWVVAWRPWSHLITPNTTLVFGVGAFLYLGTVTVHYLILEVDASRQAEEDALRFRMLAREAELRAFKAQIDPHFLFNSLNAVAALCGTRPEDARRMSQLLADFFRLTLRVGKMDRITLAEEIDLVSRYLAIEKVRFGDRLNTRIAVDDAASRCAVPPLLLQPLVENAVRHGIASMLEGGTVSLDAAVDDGLLRIRIENPADPDRSHARGEGIGLQNARGRLSAMSEGRAKLTAEESRGSFRVAIEVPT